jgi:hypothetical protein
MVFKNYAIARSIQLPLKGYRQPVAVDFPTQDYIKAGIMRKEKHGNGAGKSCCTWSFFH